VPDTTDPNALVYRPDIDSATTVFPPGSDPLTFTFTPTFSAHYAVTMVSTTIAVTDFNDCWFKFADGLTLRKIKDGVQEPLKNGGSVSVKAYQNSAKKSKAAWSVDEDFHSIETTNVLTAGTE